MKTVLAAANQAFRMGQASLAMAGYINALLKMPELSKVIAGNISLTRNQFLKGRKENGDLKIVVCGWELSHNAAGRAHTLAEIYQEITSDVQIVGSIFTRWGREVWEPIRDTSIPINTFVAEPDRFIEQALALVASHPADVVHLSKPRAPNIIFGICYKLLWGARVIVDIDDEELAFVKAKKSISIQEYLREYPSLPPLEQLTDTHWTQIAVGLVKDFDAITVSNNALQGRYGGTVIGHARNPQMLRSDIELRKKRRRELGIQQHHKVILFSGTPRPHKGLLEVAQTISKLKRKDIIFLVVGTFDEKYIDFKRKLQSIKEVNYLFLENQPFSKLQNTLAVADCCVLFQDVSEISSEFQIPAKLTDALAMGVPVIATKTPALADVVDCGAVAEVDKSSLYEKLQNVLNCDQKKQIEIGKDYFKKNLSLSANSCKLIEIIKNIGSSPLGCFASEISLNEFSSYSLRQIVKNSFKINLSYIQ